MRFGLIGDIHGNLPALETVLKELDACSVEGIFDVGDLVCYGPFPNDVVRLARQRGIVSIQGNRDRQVYEFHTPTSLPPNGELTAAQMKVLAYEWAHNSLTDENLDYLKSLPECLSEPVGSHRLLMLHSMPLHPDSPDSEFGETASKVEEDVIAFGHTHIPFVVKTAGKLFANTGSVGRPADSDPRAAYVLLTVEPERIEAQVKRVAYDVQRTMEAVYQSDLANAFANMFAQGRKLDDIVKSGGDSC